MIQVWNGKGGKSRNVPVLAGHEQDVLFAKESLAENDLVFPRIPKHLDVHSYRREYAQALYLHHAPERRLPLAAGRLKRQDDDQSIGFVYLSASKGTSAYFVGLHKSFDVHSDHHNYCG